MARYRAANSPTAMAANDLGTTFREMHIYDRAVRYLSDAVEQFRAMNTRSGEAESLNELGRTYGLLNRHDEELRCLKESLLLAREIRSPQREAMAEESLMIALRETPPLAILFGKNAINLYQQIRGNLQSLDRHTQGEFLARITAAYRTLADLLISQGRLIEAQEVLDLLKQDEYFRFIRRGGMPSTGVTYTANEAAANEGSRVGRERLATIGARYGELRAVPRRTQEQNDELAILADEIARGDRQFWTDIRSFTGKIAARPLSAADLPHYIDRDRRPWYQRVDYHQKPALQRTRKSDTPFLADARQVPLPFRETVALR